MFPHPTISLTKKIICAGDCIQPSATATNNPTSWKWDFTPGNPASSNVQNPPQVCYANAGTYQLILVTDNGIGRDTVVSKVTIVAPPSLVIKKTHDSLVVDQGYSYQWYYKGGILNGATNFWYIPVAGGVYTVNITDEHGCSSTSDEYNFLSTSVAEPVRSGEINIYPNPASGEIQVLLGCDCTGCSVKVFDITGKVVISKRIVQENFTLDISQLPPGIYCLQVNSMAQTISARVVKE